MIALLLAAALPLCAAVHPLDPLDEAEVTKAVEVLKRSGRLKSGMLFPTLALNEPPKAEVLAWTAGSPFRREAFAALYDRRAGKAYEAVVDLAKERVASWKELPGVQPPVLLSEFEELPAVVAADPRWRKALERRGIKDLEEVQVDIWAYGSPDAGKAAKPRLLRALSYYKGKGKNFYARPIEGLSAVLDADARKVLEVVDGDVYPLPPVASELDKESLGPQREALAPFVITQPEGPAFSVEGSEVRWDRWRFRFAMHPREGLVLYQVAYQDGAVLRPVMYRASLSEMMVPYGHADGQWTWRAAFDEGEYGIGRYSGSLAKGVEVPENARLFDAVFVDDYGKPSVSKDVVALYERDGGLLWKHFDMYAGGQYGRRGRELVIGFITTISNYDYGLNWVFRQDGTLRLESDLTGIMLAKGVKAAEEDHSHGDADSRHAHLVAPHVAAPHHQHFFNFRLDLDVDGAGGNRAWELDARPLPPGPSNPSLNAFEMTETPIESERESARQLSYAAQRKWKVTGPRVNGLGGRSGFILVPGENAAPYLQEGSPLLTRGGFIRSPVWFTRYADGERFAAGPYPNQRAGSDGLPEWTKAGRSLEGEDLVLWYNVCVTHAPRPEEWPVMAVHKTGFALMPIGFFDRNPALDLPGGRD